MCVAFFTLDHPDYALILCSNRDEYLSRPTEPAHFHAFGGKGQQANILSGIDVQAGGTWLGLSRAGKLALLTNITEPQGTFTTSRGQLVSSFLSLPPSQSLEDDARRVIPPDARYAGFNLLLLAATFAPHPSSPSLSFDALCVTNHGGGGPIAYRPLTDAQRHRGGLSNGIDGHGADDWPKVQHGVRALDALVDTLLPNSTEDQLIGHLLDLLTWRSSQPPGDRSGLKDTIQVEPVNMGGSYYGTRLSTVVLVRRSGDVVFTERDRWKLAAQGQPTLANPTSERVFHFRIERSELSK